MKYGKTVTNEYGIRVLIKFLHETKRLKEIYDFKHLAFYIREALLRFFRLEEHFIYVFEKKYFVEYF